MASARPLWSQQARSALNTKGEVQLAKASGSRPSRLRYSHTIGLVAMEGRGFSNPVDLAISSEDRIYVVSRTNPEQPYGIRVGICNLESDYFGDFGAYGAGDGEFVWPTAVAFDGRDNLYLADEYNHRVTVFDPRGGFLSWWGEHGSGQGQLNGPAGLCFDREDNLYVADHLNHRVQKFTCDGRFLLKWGEHGSGPGQLDLPWGIALDSRGDVFVADWRNDRIQKFSPEGRYLATVGSPGRDEGRLNRPSSVAVDAEDYLYIADWGNEKVQVVEPDGTFQPKLWGSATLSKWAEEFYEANSDEKEAREASNVFPKLDPDVTTAHEASARIEQYFWGPVSVKLDREGRLYVTESNRHRIQVYVPV